MPRTAKNNKVENMDLDMGLDKPKKQPRKTKDTIVPEGMSMAEFKEKRRAAYETMLKYAFPMEARLLRNAKSLMVKTL